MVVNVKGRDIHIDDELAKEHEKLYHEPIDENLLHVYLHAAFQSNTDEMIRTASDHTLTQTINECLKMEM